MNSATEQICTTDSTFRQALLEEIRLIHDRARQGNEIDHNLVEELTLYLSQMSE